MATLEQMRQKRISRRLRNSQIAPLIDNFRASPFAFAPEFQKDLCQIRDALKISILPIWPENRFYFAADLDAKKIECGICAMERLWAYAYVYGKLAQPEAPPNLLGDSSFFLLLAWAHQKPAEREIPWPIYATSPKKEPRRADVIFANELFLGMSAFILLHEVGHLIKGEKHTTHLIDAMRHNHPHEFEADEIAWDFAAYSTLQSGSADVKEKRIGVIVLALAVMAVDAAYRGDAMDSDTHPRPIARIDRLITYLHQWGNDDGALAGAAEQVAARVLYSAAAVIMNLAGQPITSRRIFSSPRDTINYARPFIEMPHVIDWDVILRRSQLASSCVRPRG